MPLHLVIIVTKFHNDLSSTIGGVAIWINCGQIELSSDKDFVQMLYFLARAPTAYYTQRARRQFWPSVSSYFGGALRQSPQLSCGFFTPVYYILCFPLLDMCWRVNRQRVYPHFWAISEGTDKYLTSDDLEMTTTFFGTKCCPHPPSFVKIWQSGEIAQFDLRWPRNDLHFFRDQM